MGDIKKLLTDLKELDDNLVGCMRCGMCQAVCPVYKATLQEADVTRGKIALLEDLAHKVAKEASGVNDKLNRCLLCGSCQANCPSGVKVLDIFLKARAIVGDYLGFSPIQKAIFRGVLQHPALFDRLLQLGAKFQGPFMRQANEAAGTSCSPILSPLIGDRHFPKLAEQSFHKQCPSLDTPAGASGLRVAFFPGCVTDKMFPGVAAATLKVLAHYGVGVYLPAGLACCGIPAVASGDMETYNKLVQLNANILDRGDFDYLITPCATCTATIKETWPLLADNLPATTQEKVRLLAGKTMDMTAFLVNIVQIPLDTNCSKNDLKATYHDACHMRNSLGVTAEPRKIIRGASGYTFVEMPAADTCCGSGGSFTLKHYDLSKKVGNAKRDAVVASKADVVMATCPACMLQLMDMHSQNNDSVKVMHVIEAMAEALP